LTLRFYLYQTIHKLIHVQNKECTGYSLNHCTSKNLKNKNLIWPQIRILPGTYMLFGNILVYPQSNKFHSFLCVDKYVIK
jgi:hypothetical protein